MGKHGLISLIVSTALGASVAACGGMAGDPGGTQSAVAIEAKDSDASFTLTSASGLCVASEQFYAEIREVLMSRCGEHALPLPRAVDDPSCSPGQIASMTFDCYEGSSENVCEVFVLKDELAPLPPVFQELPGKPRLFCTVLPSNDERLPPPPPVGGAVDATTDPGIDDSTEPPPWPILVCCPDPPPPPGDDLPRPPPVGGSSS